MRVVYCNESFFFSFVCAVTVGTDVLCREGRIHLLTPLGVGNNIHSTRRQCQAFTGHHLHGQAASHTCEVSITALQPP